MTEGPSWSSAIDQIFHVIPDLATSEQAQTSLRGIERRHERNLHEEQTG